MEALIASIYWDASPEFFSVGPITVRWYGLLFALGFAIGYQILWWMFRREGHSQKELDTLTVYMVAATIIGARLGHCFFYNPDYYLANPMKILMIWEGGLASHGAAIGIVLGVWIFAATNKRATFLWTADRLLVPVALAAAFVRLGNFMNSEILGHPADVPWAVVFASYDSVPRHPAQLYEAISYIAIFVFLLLYYKKHGEKTPRGILAGMFLILLFSARFFLEFFKMQQADFAPPLGIQMGQWLSIPFIITGIIMIRRSRPPEVAGNREKD
ncbi:MAG: prolipoprotein diacylglyceryl transferase [Candidatus Kapaibacterium sp.]